MSRQRHLSAATRRLQCSRQDTGLPSTWPRHRYNSSYYDVVRRSYVAGQSLEARSTDNSPRRRRQTSVEVELRRHWTSTRCSAARSTSVCLSHESQLELAADDSHVCRWLADHTEHQPHYRRRPYRRGRSPVFASSRDRSQFTSTVCDCLRRRCVLVADLILNTPHIYTHLPTYLSQWCRTLQWVR